MRKLFIAGILTLTMAPLVASAQQPPGAWDGLVRVESRNFDAAYLAPGATFDGYTKVMLDDTQVAFRQNWLRDHNTAQPELSDRISDNDARDLLQAVQTGFQNVFTAEYTGAGYQVVTTPGPDVLRIRTAIANLDVEAPDRSNPGYTRAYSRQAGEAVLVVELRDSMSGALLGRGVDQRDIGDTDFLIRRSSATNRQDFERMFRTWARMSVTALGNLKAMSGPAIVRNASAP